MVICLRVRKSNAMYIGNFGTLAIEPHRLALGVTGYDQLGDQSYLSPWRESGGAWQTINFNHFSLQNR